MLDIKFIADNLDAVQQSIELRHVGADAKAVVKLYDEYRALKQEVDDARAIANKIAKSIGKATAEDRPKLIEQGSELKKQVAKLEDKEKELKTTLDEALLTIPNMLAEDVPAGKDDTSNVVISKYLEPTKFDFKPKDHLKIGKDLDLIDFEGGAKVAGAKFYFLKNEAVLLEMALQHFAFKKAMERGFIPLQTPDIARNEVMLGAGFAPRGNESNTYRIEDTDLSLVATAEIAVGGLHANEIIAGDMLPLKYIAWSHCFRTEAGAGGQASKGMYRVHQFSKAELYVFCKPEQSANMLEELRELEESIYQDLGLPYQVVNVCAGDLGAPAYKKYDIEAWMPGKGENGEYGEVTSASNCTDFQARRLNIRYKDKKTGKNRFVHTLNGTAIAMSRTPVAILENFQTEDGSVKIPEVLQNIMGVSEIKAKNNTDDVSNKKLASA